MVGGPSIENTSDVGMVHEGQCLSFDVEAGHYLCRIHSQLDDFKSDFALDRLRLLGKENGSHSSFSYGFKEAIGTDRCVGFSNKGSRV